MDSTTAFNLDLAEAARLRQGASLLIREGVARFEEAARKERESRRGGFSWARALKASGEFNWADAPNEQAESQRLAQLYGRSPRATNGFFIAEGLQTRAALDTATVGAAAELVGVAAPLAVEAARPSNSFLGLCSFARPGPRGDVMIGKLSDAPAVTVMANESDTAGDESPEATQSILQPVNLTCHITESRQLDLQTGAMGANAIRDLLVGALRTQAQVQILTGAGTNGEALGLCADSTIPTASGGTLAFSTVADAVEDVEAGAGDGLLAWVVTAPAANILRKREIASGSGPILDGANRICGYRCIVVGGTTDAVAVFGRWRDLLIFEWATVEIAVNPFANFRGQRIGIRGWLTFNAAPKIAGSFSTITAIT